MKLLYSFLILAVFVFSGCKKEKPTKNGSVETKIKNEKSATTVSIKKVTYKELKPLLNKKNDSIYVVNFWATWCKPCVKELPYFEKLKAAYTSKKVNVLLVSLDFPNQIESRLKPFIAKKNLQSDIVLLDDINEDVWIKAISEKWSGAIPATIIYNKNKHKFYEQSFEYKTLENELQTFLN